MLRVGEGHLIIEPFIGVATLETEHEVATLVRVVLLVMQAPAHACEDASGDELAIVLGKLADIIRARPEGQTGDV